MRQALTQAIHHARHRSAFGKRLAEQPLMQNVLADLALESEAATMLMLRLARAFESNEPIDRAWSRIVTPAAKFWVCKRALEFSGECMEVWGGNGYVETGPMARMYREAPVNSIWEGSGNVMCLDVLRACEREPQALALLLHDLQDAAGSHEGMRTLVASVRQDFAIAPEQRELLARRLAQKLVIALQASLMMRHAPSEIAEAFLASRTDSECGRVYGTLPAAAMQARILERAWPL
jgi:putative acyl-CoA dehydrogenase